MLKKIKGVDLFQWIVNISTIIALIIQCFSIPKCWQVCIAFVVILLCIMSIIISIVVKENMIYTRTQLIQATKNCMINSTGKIVMFGGDLSWSDDYIDVITNLTNNNQVVEIIFPIDKIVNSKGSVITNFEKRVCALKKAGAMIYSSENDYHLRCTLIDVEPGRENEDLCIISSKRIYRDALDHNQNKYQVNILKFDNEEERALCNSFYRNYCLIMNLCSKY